MPPRGGPQRGDHTGAEKDRLAREHADELARRSGEIGMVTEVDTVIEEEGIFDPATGTVIEIPPDAQAKIDAAEQSVQYVTLDDDPIYELGEGPSAIDVRATFNPTQTQQQPQPDRSNVMEVQGDPGVMIVEKEWKVIRVNTDIEDMTYGAGTRYTFLRGKRYRVPWDLYEWLENRQVVYH
jgi:hypothetical protein